MDWPISWQKVKESGSVIFDIADYGLVLDPNNPETMKTTNVSIMSDVEQAVNDGKTVFLKIDATKIGSDGYIVTPVIGHWFDKTYGFSAISAASLFLPLSGPAMIVALDFGLYFNGDVPIFVKMTLHQFAETPIE